MDCSVCLSSFRSGGKTVVLPCGHSFHRSCAERCTNRRCPLCQQPFEVGTLRPNFALEEIMGDTGFLDRMRSISMERVEALAEKSIPRVMTIIEKAARRGRRYINIPSSSLPLPWLTDAHVRASVCRRVHDTMREMGIDSCVLIGGDQPVIHIHW